MAADPGGCRHGAPNGLPPGTSDTFELHQRIVSAGEGPSGAGDTGGLGVASDTAPAADSRAADGGAVGSEPPTTATPAVDGLPPLHTVGAGRGQGKAGLGVINASPTRGSCVCRSNASPGFLSPTTPSGAGSDSSGDAASIFRLKQQLYNLKEQLRCVKVEASQRLDRERRAWQLERTALVEAHDREIAALRNAVESLRMRGAARGVLLDVPGYGAASGACLLHEAFETERRQAKAANRTAVDDAVRDTMRACDARMQVIEAGWAAKVLEMQAEHERLLCDVRAGAAASLRRRLAAAVHRYEAQLAVVRGALAHTRGLVLTLRQALGD